MLTEDEIAAFVADGFVAIRGLHDQFPLTGPLSPVERPIAEAIGS